MTPKEPKHWGTKKGDLLGDWALWQRVEGTIDHLGLTQIFPFSENEINELLRELIRDGDVNVDSDNGYSIRDELVKDYIDYIDYEIQKEIEEDRMGVIQVPSVIKRDITIWTDGWIKIHKPEISLENKHFFLEGHLLDTFIKFLISKANETIIVVNPFLDMITPTQLLIQATRNNKRVVLVTRPPENLSQRARETHKLLLDSRITILYAPNLHAKILLFDDKIAIVSSMNFLQRATAGISWEAGIVTLDEKTVNMIKDSITNLKLEPSRT